jgi:thiol-disulfide isomerase/thioredoxin
MFRRQFFMFLVLGVASIGSALAHDGHEIIPGFDEALAAGSPILIHVTAPWCEVCQLQKPIVAELLSRPDFKDMKTFDVDFDSQKEILARYRVQMQSTMIVYKAGEEVDRQTGQSDPAVIGALLRKAL